MEVHLHINFHKKVYLTKGIYCLIWILAQLMKAVQYGLLFHLMDQIMPCMRTQSLILENKRVSLHK